MFIFITPFFGGGRKTTWVYFKAGTTIKTTQVLIKTNTGQVKFLMFFYFSFRNAGGGTYYTTPSHFVNKKYQILDFFIRQLQQKINNFLVL